MPPLIDNSSPNFCGKYAGHRRSPQSINPLAPWSPPQPTRASSSSSSSQWSRFSAPHQTLTFKTCKSSLQKHSFQFWLWPHKLYFRCMENFAGKKLLHSDVVRRLRRRFGRK
uniref:Uncharacterized protein n=1 Tax=Physcomitrium patens TaxID=3218 RepID=A0A2K1JHF8_PHYPA|nr:hypothetical protein PHYPA_018395 [Physcomitrium patens]